MKIVIIEPLGITPEKLAEATAAVKARGHEIVAYDTKEEDQDKLAERGKDADIIIIANQPFRKNVIEKCKNLKLLSVAFTGVDHIDVDFCKEKGICVCNAAGYSTNAVAELAFGLAISVLRNIPACDAVCRKEGAKAGLVGGELFGVIRTGLREPFSPEEEQEWIEELIGQAADGFGEGLEQREIHTDDGDLYVSFWNSGDDYFMENESDFRQRMTGSPHFGNIQME